MVWIGIVGSIIAQIMYGMSSVLKSQWLVLGSRFVGGSCCYLALSKTYTALTTGRHKRPFYFSILGTVLLSDVVIAFFSAAAIDAITKSWTNDFINRYTAPAWFMCCLYICFAFLFELYWHPPTVEELGRHHYHRNNSSRRLSRQRKSVDGPEAAEHNDMAHKTLHRISVEGIKNRIAEDDLLPLLEQSHTEDQPESDSEFSEANSTLAFKPVDFQLGDDEILEIEARVWSGASKSHISAVAAHVLKSTYKINIFLLIFYNFFVRKILNFIFFILCINNK